jgi:hypothetical protein
MIQLYFKKGSYPKMKYVNTNEQHTRKESLMELKGFIYFMHYYKRTIFKLKI